jgi:isoprenylcysteine carboxyl methyltransferase (ICMT) family protein YpbQ
MHPRLMILFSAAAVLRLGSLAVSMHNEKALKAQGAREYGHRTSRLLALAHTVFYLGALAEGLWRGTQPTPWTTVGLILYGLSVIAFVLVWRALNRFWTVKLLIASDHVLNQSALFRWVRHPNYFLNIVPELCGLALLMGAWLVLVLGLPGDAAALSPVRDASVATACPGHHAWSSLRLMAGVGPPGPWRLSVPAMQQDGRRADEVMPGLRAAGTGSV